MSKQSVVKRAVKEGWQDLRHKTLLEVDQKLTEIVGEDIAIVNARHAQIGKVLQVAALKAMKERNLNPENFMQAVRAIVEGVKIERETLNIREAKREGEVAERGGIFNNPEFAKKYSFNKYKLGVFNNPAMAKEAAIREPVTQSHKPLLTIASVNKPPEQTQSNKPLVDPKLLEQIQEKLSEMKIRADELKKKLEAEQSEIESTTSLSGWH